MKTTVYHASLNPSNETALAAPTIRELRDAVRKLWNINLPARGHGQPGTLHLQVAGGREIEVIKTTGSDWCEKQIAATRARMAKL